MMNSSGQAHKTRKDLSMSRSRSFPTTKRNDRWSSSSPCVNEGLRPRNSETIVTVNKHDPESGLTLSLPDTEGAAENSLIRRTPMYKTPLPGQNLKWHLDEDLSIDWGALFYDLVLVAALSAFTSSHRLAAPSDIPAFASYYVILYFVWVSQVFYDIRYEGEDSTHRIFKFLQICVLVYIGSASGNWAPEDLRSSGDGRVTDNASAITRDAEESFTVIVSAFIASRVILAVQYLICALVGKKLKRRTRPFWISIASLVTSVIILLVVVGLSPTSHSIKILRLTLLYLTIVLELAVLTFQVYAQTHVTAETRKVGERYSAVVLIVLGEGLITLVGAFNDGLAGLSDNDFGTYGQAVLAVAISYLLYTFLFARFKKERGTGRRRRLGFELIHFPLTFGLLLMFNAMVNVIVVTSHGSGTASVLTDFAQATEDASNNLPLTAELQKDLGRYLYKMPLYPPFDVLLDQLRGYYNSSSPTNDPGIVTIQYAGQILGTSFGLYDIDITDNTVYALSNLVLIDSSYTDNTTLRQERIQEATSYLYQINTEPFESAMSGTLWLFPTAGIVLILCTLRSLSWSYTGTPLANLVIISFQITGGVVLALLGLLGVGDKSFDVGEYARGELEVLPMYKAVLNLLPLIIVCVVYAAVQLTPVMVLEVIDRYKEPVFAERNVGWRRRLGYMFMGI